jgi:hypothetical protein
MKATEDDVPAREFEGIQVSDSDFVAAPDEGSSISSGEVTEVFRAEIGEDGQFSSYSALQLGGTLGPTGQSAQGKIFADLRDNNDNKVDDRTEIRFVARPKNGNSRTALTEWYPIRDLDRDDPRQRQPLPPVTDSDGDPQVVQDGRIVAVEVRNGATSIEVDLTNTTFAAPAQGGY